MRITENMRFSTVQRSLASLRSRHAELVNQISTGRRVSAPSDDPSTAATLMRLGARAARTADYQKTISTVRADVSLTESHLAQASGLMVRANELAIQGANDTLSAQDRAAIAAEVGALQEQLVSTGNARGERGFLFSGSQVGTPALSSTGGFQGDDNDHQVEISPGVFTRVSVSGAEAFTAAGGTDAYAALESLRLALLSNDSAQISSALPGLEASRGQIVSAQGQAGLILNRLDTADEALSVTSLELTRQQGEMGDVDPFAALSELTQLSTTLEQAISVARMTLSTGNDHF